MIEREYADAPLADKRLAHRLVKIAAMAVTEPAASFPQMARSDGELESIYRFLNNHRVAADGILEPHYRATLARMAPLKRVAVVHDSTQFAFRNGVAEVLGYLPGPGQRGIVGHFALAVDDGGVPLGVLGVEALTPPAPKRRRRGKKHRLYDRTSLQKLAARWGRLVRAVRERVDGRTSVVHVMDREADSYELMHDISEANESFVIRLRHRDRLARSPSDEKHDWRPVEEVATGGRYVAKREVPVSTRRHSKDQTYKRRYPERDRRVATLRVEALPAVFKKPGVIRFEPNLPASINVNIVRVWEPSPPPGEDSIEWLLITNEPIETQQQVEAVVDWYRRRWKIEEYFKALKTGCAFERRQLQTRAALVNTLALLAPIAWQLLTLRDQVRKAPEASARTVLSQQQIKVLHALSKRPLPRKPTVEQALLAIAAQGGHLKRNGPPGWQTLGRGLEKLWWAEMGYQVGRAEALGHKGNCDR
jgi:IS4 transposase